jgi:mannose-6-phosphate isomerase class I
MKSDKYKQNIVELTENLKENIYTGYDGLFEMVFKAVKNKKRVIAIDGYPLIDWSFIENLVANFYKKNLKIITYDILDFYKDKMEIYQQISKNINCDKYFGKVYDGTLENFLDTKKIESLKNNLNEIKHDSFIAILYGCGAANRYLKDAIDYSIYIDLTREKFLERIKNNKLWFISYEEIKKGGTADVGLSIDTFKLIQYICYPVFDKYRRQVLKSLDFYGDSSNDIKFISKDVFDNILKGLSSMPLSLKSLYIEGPWGGNWIKNIRRLPDTFRNCAWAFDAVANDLSIPVLVDNYEFDIPFNTLLAQYNKQVMGEKAAKIYKYFFPVRVHYDDSFNGGNMAIQVHPDKDYVKKYFNESVGQDEAYFILKTQENTKVYLGLTEACNIKEFYSDVVRSKNEKIPLDYEKYVNSCPSNPMDLFLIPAGTIHALGKNQVCLEIGTSYGYTFHVYDYLRPSLNGVLREIHEEHAFNSLNDKRSAKWVEEHLKPVKKLIHQKANYSEYLFESYKDIPFEVRIIEFSGEASFEAIEEFQILSLIDGNNLLVKSENKVIQMEYTETLIIPANIKYTIASTYTTQIIKVFLK